MVRRPALIVCPGALERKDGYFDLCRYLEGRGIAALALDMHGHGQSGGARYRVCMREWTADIRAAVDFLRGDRRIRPNGIGAFGLSSGATAVLEAAIQQADRVAAGDEPCLRALVVLDATVRDTMPWTAGLRFRLLLLAGIVRRALTGKDLLIDISPEFERLAVAADPEANRRFLDDPHFRDGLRHFPLPGAVQSYLVDTLRRAGRIRVPTLVLHGALDRVEPPQTSWLLYGALTGEKELHIIPGNGHAGHIDRHRDQVMELIANWALRFL